MDWAGGGSGREERGGKKSEYPHILLSCKSELERGNKGCTKKPLLVSRSLNQGHQVAGGVRQPLQVLQNLAGVRDG